ncbi:M23 family metallopeptidase [Parashewanella spongiae]|uniref:M23 family metallopeptidase n=1 Tax=Parashewanella spongiae TaxID=342950 RepID=A0A3A6TX36_9GAMM|nr:M23 family metallopeptidase [Parashewanella spongiae]MCL1078572.1 M23 family metallopeptidase [Parashewanella spongiae]RJY19029.1 M23 family metallopeptidase [Parashewanella spongiae]
MKSPLVFLSLFLCFSNLSLAEVTTVENQVQFNGDFKQGALIRAKVTPNSKVTLNGRVLNLAPSGDFVFGFGRDAKVKHELKVVYPNGLAEIKPITLVAQKYNIQQIKGISKTIMQPDLKAIARSKKDSKQVREARHIHSTNKAVFSDFIWPLTGRISGVYGSQRVYNGKPGRPHFGVDVAAKTGTVVIAPADGVVSLAVPDMFYSGGTLIIDHGYGVSSSMLHLSKLYVKKGQRINKGDEIAEVGATGRATGPHLDWRLNWYQERLDPTTIVSDMKTAIKQN